MNRLCLAAVLLVLSVLPNLASAVEIKNPRPRFGPLGPTRYDAKCLPGDILFMTYEIEGLMVDPKTKKVKFETVLELLDAKGTVLFTSPATAEAVPDLGGATMPGHLSANAGTKPGKYSVRLSVKDLVAKNGVAFKYDYEIVPEAFGFVRVMTPTLGLPGDYHAPQFFLVNLNLDAKTKKPDAEVVIRVTDDKGKVVSEAKMILPKDMPEGIDLEQSNAVPFRHPIYLNRTGRFTVEVIASDNSGKKKAELRYPLTVLDLSGFTK